MRTRAHLLPIVLGGTFAAGALALVAYLLWPTWSTGGKGAAEHDREQMGSGAHLVPP